MAAKTPTTAQPAAPEQARPQVPFALASRRMTRFSFTTGQQNLSAAANLPINPVQIPAVGYLSGIMLEVTIGLTLGASAPTYTADAPFNSLAAVELRTAAGNDIIVPFTGYQLYLTNKWGTQLTSAPFADPKLSRQYNVPAGTINVGPGALLANGQYNPGAANTIHYFLWVPLEIDLGNGYGSIPALASNRAYQLNLIAAAYNTFLSGGNVTTVTMTINGTAFYWSEPPAVTASGMTQAVTPVGIGTVSQWQYEAPVLSGGDKYVKSNNVGNVIRCMIFVLRNASGVREETDWPGICELYLDNEPMFYLPQTLWEEFMTRRFGYYGATKDQANALDTGVFVIPFHALTGDLAGSAANGRNQYLPTGDASLLQLRGTSFGAGAATLEILTNSVIPTDAASLYSR